MKSISSFKPKISMLPSVSWLINKHHIEDSEISRIKPSGPRHRLLKGDVLEYLQSATSNALPFERYLALDIYYREAPINIAKLLSKTLEINSEMQLAKPPFYLSRYLRGSSIFNTKIYRELNEKQERNLSETIERIPPGSFKFD